MQDRDNNLLDNAKAVSSTLSRFAFSKLSLKTKILIASLGILFLFVMAISGSTSSSQLNSVFYLTPRGEENLKPSADIKEKVLYDIGFARKRTDNLLKIINSSKETDKDWLLDDIKGDCRQNGWDIDRTMNMLSDVFEENNEYSSQNSRILSAFSISLDNGQLVKSGASYTNQAKRPVKTYIFGEHKGEINYEETLKKDLNEFLKSGHFYILTYEMEEGHIKVYEDVEIEYEEEEIPVLGKDGKPTGKTETIYVPVYYYYYYVHPILIEREINSMAEEIFGLDTNAPYTNSVSFEGEVEVGKRGVISNKDAITFLSMATDELLYGSALGLDKYYIGEYNGIYEWPAPGNSIVTSLWGPRIHPITGIYTNHGGTDIAGSFGDSVVAAEEGTVIFAGTMGTYGNLIKISHPDGNITYYAHLSKILVYEGLEVKKGQEIGKIGSTGRSTGPHLHFEVRINGSTVDSLSFICDREMYENLVYSL